MSTTVPYWSNMHTLILARSSAVLATGVACLGARGAIPP